VWTKDQEQQKSQLKRRIESLEEKLKQDTPELLAGRESGSSRALSQLNQWVVLDPHESKVSGGDELTEQPDQALLVSGTRAQADTYTITRANEPDQHYRRSGSRPYPTRACRPAGAGRADDGGFVLNDLKLSVSPAQPAAPAGRFVRVELPGRKRLLSLAEVQVFTGDKNLALGGKGQPIQHHLRRRAGARDRRQHQRRFLRRLDHPHRRVDRPVVGGGPGKLAPVDRVVLWNRTDSNLQSRLKDARVILLDESRKPVWESRISEVPDPSVALDTTGPQAVALRNASDTAHRDGGEWSARKASTAAPAQSPAGPFAVRTAARSRGFETVARDRLARRRRAHLHADPLDAQRLARQVPPVGDDGAQASPRHAARRRRAAHRRAAGPRPGARRGARPPSTARSRRRSSRSAIRSRRPTSRSPPSSP
jgi:hypothetical protein